MAKNEHGGKRTEAKSGQYIVPEKTFTGTLSPKSSKFHEAGNGKRSAIKIATGNVNAITGMPHSGSYIRNTSIIAEKSGRPEWQLTPVEKMDLVREGVSKKDLERLKTKTNLDYDKLSILLSTTRATLINKKGAAHFSASLGERIVSIADLYSYGFEVFEDETKFNEWVFRPNQALGGRPPFELIDNQFGREEVKNVIGRIDYGVYS